MAVARRTIRQVGTTPLPGVRGTAAESDLSTGAGLELARGQKLERVAGVTGRMAAEASGALSVVIREERQKANETALLKASNRLESWKRERLYNPETGALTLKGEAAQPLPEQIAGEFETVAGEIASGLSTDEQRAAFERVRAQVLASTDLEVRRHVFGEMQEFRANELTAAISNGTDAAIRSAADPELVALNLNRVESQMRTNLPRLGVGKDALEQKVADVRSSVHIGVINQLLATDQDKKASAYLEGVRDQIAADKLDDVDKALEEGSLRGEAQTRADAIIAAGGSLKDKLAKAKDLDPKLRDLVEQRLEHQAILDDRAEKVAEEDSMRRGYDIIDQTGSINRIPAGMWSSYTGATRSAMRSYAEQKARGVPIKTDLPTYYELMRQAMNSPETFTQQNLLNYRGKLDEPEFKQLAALQLSIKNGDRADAEKSVADFRTAQQVVDDALVGVAIDPNVTVKQDPTKANAVANLRRMVDLRVADLQATTGKKASSKDVQEIVDGLLSRQVQARGSWLGAFTAAPFFDTTKPLIETTIDDIPAETKEQIEEALRGQNRPVTDATVLSLYLEAVARGRVK